MARLYDPVDADRHDSALAALDMADRLTKLLLLSLATVIAVALFWLGWHVFIHSGGSFTVGIDNSIRVIQ